MAPDWIAPLQQMMRELSKLIDVLIKDWDLSFDKHEKKDFDIIMDRRRKIVRYTQTLKAWTEALPLEDDFWALFPLLDPFAEAKLQLSNLVSCLGRLHRARSPYVAPYDPLLTAITETQAYVRTIQGKMQDVMTLYDQEVESPHQCSPRVIVHDLCLHAYPRSLRQLPTAFPMQDWPQVLYYSWVHSMLHDLVAAIWGFQQSTPAYLLVERTPDFCEITLAGAFLHLRPEMWEAMTKGRRAAESIERLRMCGYQVDPLTWSDGYGEGVIMRIPWASS